MWLWRPTLGLLLVLLAADASLASSSAASIAPKDSTTAKKDAKAQTAADTINYYTIIIRGEPAPAGSSAPAPNSGPTGSGKPKELVVDSIEDVERLAKKWRQQKQQQQQQQQPKKAARTPGSGRDSKEGKPAPDEFLKDFLESHSVFGPGFSNKQLEEEPADSNTGEPTEDTELPDQQTSNTDDGSSSSSGSGSSSSRSSWDKEDSSSSQDSINDVDTEDSRQKEEPEESSSSKEEESDNSSSRTRARESERSDGDEEQPQRSSRRQKQQGEQEDKASRGKERREARGEEERPEHGDSEADAPRRRQQQQQQADDSPADDSGRKQHSSRSKARDSDDSEGSSKGRDSEGSSRAKDTDSAGGSSRVRRQQPEEEEDPSEGGNSKRDESKQRSEERDSRHADSKQQSEEHVGRRADSRQRSEEHVEDSKQRSEEHVDDSKQRSEERDSRRADNKQRSEEREAEAPRDADTDRERRSYADTREEEERQWQARDADEYRRGYEDSSGSRRSSEEGREEPEPSGSYPRLEEDGGYFRRPDLHSTCLQVIKATGDASGLSTYDLRCCDHKDDPKVCMRTEDPTYTSFNSNKVAAPASPKSMMEVLKAHGSQKVATCAFTPTDAPCPASEAGHPAGGCQAFKGTCMLAKSASECGCPSGTGTGVLLEVTAFAYRAAALSCSPVFTTAQPDGYYGGYGGGPDPLDDGPPYLGVGVVMKGSGHVLADNDLRARMTFISGFGVPTQPAPIYGRRRQLLSSGRDATIMNEAILRARMGTKAPSPPAVSGMSGLGFGWRAPPAVSSHSRQSAAVTPMYGPYSLQGPYSSRQPPMAFTPAPSTPLPVPDLPFLLGGRMIIEWIAAPSK